MVTTARHLPVHGVPSREKSSLGKAVTMHACMQQKQQRSGILYSTYIATGFGIEGRRPRGNGEGKEGRIENLPSVPCSTCKRVEPCWLVEFSVSSTSFDDGRR